MEDSIEYRIKGRDVLLDAAKKQDLKKQLVKLLESCANRSRKRVLENDWVSLRTSGNALELKIAEPQQITAASGAQLIIDGIIYSVKEPFSEKSLVMARHGGTYYSPFFGCNTDIFDTLSTMLTEL